jgi:hypothetical protein
MNKSLLIDYVSHTIADIQIISEGQDKNPNTLMRVKGKLQEAGIKNGNGRIYPLDILKEQIRKYIDGPLKSRTSLGELDHPDSSIINLNNTSHLITKIWWEGSNVMGELELLNTPSGKIAQEIIKSKIPLGISSRGMGSVQQIGETVEVQDDFELLCWDLVSAPSTPNAYLYITEGKNNNNFSNYKKVNDLITDIICTHTGVCLIC